LTLIGTGRRAMPQHSLRYFIIQLFYRTFSGGLRPRDAPQCAGRIATEGGDERAGVKSADISPVPPTFHTATPAANNATWDAQARHYTQSTAVARNDAPRIGERAPPRGRSSTEGGDEHGGVKGAIRSSASFRIQASTDPHRAISPLARGYIIRHPASPATTRHPSANAPRRAGAAQPKVAMSS
jgi:hypothetical protein